VPTLASCNYCGLKNKIACSNSCQYKTQFCSDCCKTYYKCRKGTATATNSNTQIKVWSIGSALEVHDVLVDGSLTIYIHLEQLERSAQCVRNVVVAATEIPIEKKLSRDLGALLESGTEADLDIKVKGSGGIKFFKAHKCILAARSSILRSRLEKLTGELVVEDISSDAVQIILKYIYCGTVDMDMNAGLELVTELINASSKVN